MSGRRYRGATPVGATGKFPQGKVDPTDEGELQFAVAADFVHGTITFAFGKPVAWMAFPPDIARRLAGALLEKAEQIEQRPPGTGRDTAS